MKKENKFEKKLSLKKIQMTKLNLIRGGGDGNDGGGSMTNGDTTKTNTKPKTDTGLPPVVILGDGSGDGDPKR